MDFMNMTSKEILATFYIYANIISTILFLILFIKTIRNKQTKSRYFANILFYLMLYFIADSLWALAYFEIIPNSNVMLKITRMIYYSSAGLIAYSWLMYVEILIDSPFAFNKKRRILLMLVLLSTFANIIICLFLDPSQKNIYGYLTAFSLIIVPLSFIITAGVQILLKQIKIKDKNEKTKYRLFALWPIIILAICVLQLFIAEFPIFCFGSLIVIISVYIYNQDSFIFTDTLTGIGNRAMISKLFKDISSKLNEYFILMIDIDRFKQINDNRGHIEGDRALKYVANKLKVASTTHNSFLGRYGGDEFVIISRTNNVDEINNIISLIETLLKNSFDELGYKLTVSIGYSKLDSSYTIEDAIAKADEMMYKNKIISHNN